MIETSPLSRPEIITENYILLIEKHLDELVKSKTDKMLEIEDFAELMFIHPTHLSNTIKEITGVSACGIFQERILELVLKLLSDKSLSIKYIALLLTFEPSQFTKWFKRLYGSTPKQYRTNLPSNTEMKTIF